MPVHGQDETNGGHVDQQAFHRLTTVIATATSRRAAMRAAVAILVGGAGLAATTDAGAATCRRGRQTCSRNAQCCSGTCQTGRGIPTRDRNRCTCEAGTRLCGTTCVDTDTDKRHCGACGNACNAGDTCIDGDCRIHQQCYSRDGEGMCYMTPNGREHRADGLYLSNDSPGFVPTPCRLASDCGASHPGCGIPGVTCTCVRWVDTGDGYNTGLDAGTGLCLPLLDNGDDAVLCRQSEDESVCVYTATSTEQLICTDFANSAGPCNAGSCAGVGDCDSYDGVTEACVCAIATKGLDAFVPLPIYWRVQPFGSSDPTCIHYRVPISGSCDFES